MVVICECTEDNRICRCFSGFKNVSAKSIFHGLYGMYQVFSIFFLNKIKRKITLENFMFELMNRIKTFVIKYCFEHYNKVYYNKIHFLGQFFKDNS